MKKILSLLLVTMFILCALCACGTDSTGDSNNDTGKKENAGSFDTTTKADESMFEWDGNLITAITSDGAKKESVLIPARCEGFSGVVFQETEIKHVAFEDNDDIALDFAFMGADKIVSVKLPSEITMIPSMAFQGCKSLTEIVLPTEVATLEGYSFSGCISLEKLVFEGNKLTVIGENCFEDCAALKSVTIPNGVTSIEKYAFADCTSLGEIVLSDTVKNIAKFAFGNTGIKEIHFPASIQFETMDASAFGTTAYTTVAYIVKDSWCDQNQEKWNIGFSEVKYE